MKATRSGKPWVLVWSIEKGDRSLAMILERKLKNLRRDRLIAFMKKYRDGLSDPDDPDNIVGIS